ncbi:MAG: hypothetical protein WAL40_15910, partial [Rhodoplanes sp.]
VRSMVEGALRREVLHVYEQSADTILFGATRSLSGPLHRPPGGPPPPLIAGEDERYVINRRLRR